MKLADVSGQLGAHVRDAVVITEAEPVALPGPRMVWVNQAFTEMTGYSAREAIGQTPRLLQGPDTDPETRQRIREGLNAWRPVREVLKNYTKDGKPFWVELDIKPIADSSGWYHYWVAVQRDVTKHVEDASDLRKARIAAEAANRLKSEFLANISHEIRTPLNGVIGMAQVLQLTDMTAQQKRAVSTIINSGQSLLGLIEDVLDISKIEAGQLTLEPMPITPRSLVEAAAEAVRGVAIEKRLRLDTHFGPGAEEACLLDPRRMRQVLINLAGNATKFTDAGQVVLACEVRDNHVVFEVRDSGPGVPEDQREVIFDRFQQLDGSHTRIHGGTGLGLAIVKEIIDAAHGTVQVSDAPEGGTSFQVRLPFLAATYEAAVPAPSLRRETAAPEPRRALVVEDNQVNRDVVVDALSHLGWQVDSAETAEPGLQAWRSGNYDLVIMDRQMPGMTGDKAVEVIRAEEAAQGYDQRTPILMLTANALSGAAEDALAKGVDAYVTKPFDVPKFPALSEELASRKPPAV